MSYAGSIIFDDNDMWGGGRIGWVEQNKEERMSKRSSGAGKGEGREIRTDEEKGETE